MAIIDGKWKLTTVSNMEAFYEAIHTPEPFKAKAAALIEAARQDPDNHQEELHIDVQEKKVRRQIFVKGEKIFELEYELGVESEKTGPDGRKAKGRSDLVGDNTVTFQNKGDDFEIHGSMVADGTKLILTLIGNGVTATQNFTKL